MNLPKLHDQIGSDLNVIKSNNDKLEHIISRLNVDLDQRDPTEIKTGSPQPSGGVILDLNVVANNLTFHVATQEGLLKKLENALFDFTGLALSDDGPKSSIRR